MGRTPRFARCRARQHRRLDARDRRRRARRHRHQRLGLRHDGQGLRLHAARRPGLCGQGGARLGARPRRQRAHDRARPGRAGGAAPASPSPIIRPARCSTARTCRAEPKALLAAAGFAVRDVPEGHLCCGSAGTYNLLQPELAARLRDRKVANIASVGPDAIATGNIGCIDAARRRHRTCRSCTRSSCSTGRPAGRSRRRSPRIDGARHELMPKGRWKSARRVVIIDRCAARLP